MGHARENSNMGLFDAVRSVFVSSDESDDEDGQGDDQNAGETATAQEPAVSEPRPEAETSDPDTDTGRSGTDETETMAPDETTEGESSDSTVTEGSAADSRATVDSTSPDDESGFDHLTTEEIDDGPDMAEDAAEFITEAESSETDDSSDAGGLRAEGESESIPEDDPRAEFVEQATELVEFWGEYELDFTVGSLSNLDDLVAEQWDPERFADVEFGGEDYDAQVFTETVTQLGSYFGEVLVRGHDGTWQRETGVGWTVEVPAGPNTEAAGATVTIFRVAEDCLTGASTFTGMHDALADRLDLVGRAGEGDTPVDLERADIETVASDEEIEDAAERLQAGAEDLADRWPDYDLDFSVESLGRLEDLLDAEVDQERFEGVELGDDTDEKSMLLTAHVVGVAGYLAEVLRRQRNAEWADKGRMLLVVEHDDSRTRIDPIEVAITAVRGQGSLESAIPDS